ncbi:Metallo-hydrolase/oxidoreductase [Hymenopellis radicata]|nr:Metallo-hydrolase/oxidoreductase [Hymenopellis radicata]
MSSYQTPPIISKCFGHHHSGPSKTRETSPLSVLVDPITDRKTRPSHWLNDKGWRDYSMHDYAGLAMASFDMPSVKSAKNILTVRQPTWAETRPTRSRRRGSDTRVSSWSFRGGWAARGARVLFDPVFSDRCSPSQLMGPKRFTGMCPKIIARPGSCCKSLPHDARMQLTQITLQHDHYDHLDTHTITTLLKRARMPHIFAPLGNERYFRSIGLTCTPAQHMTGRSLVDNFKTLWSSWVLTNDSSKVFFAGDTGYRNVRDGEDEDAAPVCPAFKEIGSRFGHFDLALIPIGAYNPRWFMSTAHAAPQDSVRIFKDVKAKKALGMHWGTWVLTNEEVTEPPRLLAEACRKQGIEDGVFDVCDIGETRTF